MLIIEGADLVGKTTLCKTILKDERLQELGYVYGHFSILPAGFDYYWGYVEAMSPTVVMDRFHLSEWVYDQVRHGKTPLNPELYRLVDAKLRLLGSYTVVVTATASLLAGRFEGRVEDYSLEKIQEANQLFFNDCISPEMDVDFRCHCTPSQPFPSPASAREIVSKYLERICILRNAQSRGYCRGQPI